MDAITLFHTVEKAAYSSKIYCLKKFCIGLFWMKMRYYPFHLTYSYGRHVGITEGRKSNRRTVEQHLVG